MTSPRRVLVAMDKFKGTLTAAEACAAVARGVRAVFPETEIQSLPVADGGEGTAEAVHAAIGGEWRHLAVPNAAGERLVKAPMLLVDHEDERVAVMEMSAACGLAMLPETERDPLKTTTKAVGEMLIHGEEEGATRTLLGIGGSATNDGGVGMALAFGYRFLDADGEEVTRLPENLEQVAAIERPEAFVAPRVTVACDVDNPLLGKDGATAVYGPQKGAGPEALPVLEKRLTHLADLVSRDLGADPREASGAGAAGGLGFGLIAFLGANLRPGFQLVADLIGLDRAVGQAEVVITGEGSLDRQTLHGKAPAGVAEMARAAGVPVFAVAGSLPDGEAALASAFDGVASLVNQTTSIEAAMADPARYVEERTVELLRLG